MLDGHEARKGRPFVSPPSMSSVWLPHSSDRAPSPHGSQEPRQRREGAAIVARLIGQEGFMVVLDPLYTGSITPELAAWNLHMEILRDWPPPVFDSA